MSSLINAGCKMVSFAAEFRSPVTHPQVPQKSSTYEERTVSQPLLEYRI